MGKKDGMNASVYEFLFSDFNIHTNCLYWLGTQNHEIHIENLWNFPRAIFYCKEG